MGSYRRIDTPAETGPGLPDEAIANGERGFEEGSDADIQRRAERLKAKGWLGRALDETEAHPS